MSDFFRLSDAQMARLARYSAKPHGKPRVYGRRVPGGIVFINRKGVRWRDAPRDHGPRKTPCNRRRCWSDKSISAKMTAGLAAGHVEQKIMMIDGEAGGAIGPSPRPNDVKAHRTAPGPGVEKGGAIA